MGPDLYTFRSKGLHLYTLDLCPIEARSPGLGGSVYVRLRRGVEGQVEGCRRGRLRARSDGGSVGGQTRASMDGHRGSARRLAGPHGHVDHHQGLGWGGDSGWFFVCAAPSGMCAVALYVYDDMGNARAKMLHNLHL